MNIKKALVGISFGRTVVYNIVDQDGGFDETGLSIINNLNLSTNDFVCDLFASQSYKSIKAIDYDHFEMGEYIGSDNRNAVNFSDVYYMMFTQDGYYYILDYVEDVLIIKTPELKKPVALEYRNHDDVRNLTNTLRWE